MAVQQSPQPRVAHPRLLGQPLPVVPVPSVATFKTSAGTAVANQVQAGQSFNLAASVITGNNLDTVSEWRLYQGTNVDPSPDAATMIAGSSIVAASNVSATSATLAGTSASALYNAVAIIADGVVIWQAYIFPDFGG